MKRMLNSRVVETLRPGPKRYEVWDANFPGLGIRVSTDGRKRFFFMKRVNGEQKRHTLGFYPALSLAQARQASISILAEIQAGTYNRARHQEEAKTLDQIIPIFVERYAKPKNKRWRETERLLVGNFKELHAMPLAEIRRADIAQSIDSVSSRRTPYQANRALSAIKKLLAWSLDRGLIEHHPAVALKPPAKEISRDRCLTNDELARVWSDCVEQGYPFGPLIQMMILTGQRRGEVSEMCWSEIDIEKRLWRIPGVRSKNGRPHDVPLSDFSIELLVNVPRFLTSDHVFTTTGHSAISGFGHYKSRLDERVGFSDWRFHDLRRTASSGMAELGVQPHVIEKVLNHVSGMISGVAAVYNRHAYTLEKREALDRWAQAISTMMSERTMTKVLKAIAMPSRAKTTRQS